MDTTTYGVQELAILAGVSVRTLHYYDQIGILPPASRTDSGYRTYDRTQLERLQQILFFRELDVPLAEIRAIVLDPEYDALEALERHEAALRARAARMTRLVETVRKTIDSLRGERSMLTDNELYDGLSPEQVEEYRNEAAERWPDMYRESNARVSRMSKEQWRAVRAEGDAVTRELAALVGTDPSSSEVQALIRRHHAWIGNFYHATPEIYTGLAELYTSDPRFTANYEKHATGLAEFIAAAMRHFAATELA